MTTKNFVLHCGVNDDERTKRLKSVGKNVFLPFLFVVISVVFSILTGDALIGMMMLTAALLSTYYSTIGNIATFPLCIVFYGFWVYVGFINGFYLTATGALLVGIPSQIIGWKNWSKHKDDGDVAVETRSMPLHLTIALTLAIIAVSFVIAFGLEKIPGANASFLDAASNVFDIFAVFLLIMRFRESWYIFLINNVVDLSLALFAVTFSMEHCWALLAQAIGIFAMNIAAIILWTKDERAQRKHTAPKLATYVLSGNFCK